MQGKNNGERKNIVKKIEDSSCSLLSHFGALTEVHFLHAIYHFKAQEVKNPMLQTVHYSELKWRIYIHWNPITPSWRKSFAQRCEITLLLRNDFATILHSAVEFPQKFPDSCDTLEAEHRKLKSNFAALWNQPFVAKWFRSPFCASTKSRIPCFHPEMVLSASRYLRPTLLDILLQIFDV